MAHPDELPGPPADLADRDLRIVEVDRVWSRLHDRRYDPLHFGRAGRYRFDAPDQDYGVLYVSAEAAGAFIETYGQRVGLRMIDRVELGRRCLAEIHFARALRLVDLSQDGGLARAGADSRLFAGSRSVAQRWSRSFHQDPRRFDGVLYPARGDPQQLSCAVFERAAAGAVARTLGPLDAPDLAPIVAAILDRYGFALL